MTAPAAVKLLREIIVSAGVKDEGENETKFHLNVRTVGTTKIE